ncbi:MAG: bifunctional proline dehydrogenase/L-glutamate gamma-semialdehyde dehydrogenase [Fibrobacteria bacterium]|nr:bifunctional proline dehydrogenase/L-glutamate gamma-semialdehyde dehydrogenase [Fibrobacteria bacterium]
MKAIKNLLSETELNPLSPKDLPQKAVELAELLLSTAKNTQTPEEINHAIKMAPMLKDTQGKALTMALTDQVFRSYSKSRVADQLRYLIDQYGVPGYLSALDGLGLKLASVVGPIIPDFVMPLVTLKLRNETRTVLKPSEEEPFQRYLAERKASGMRLNVNQLGEAVLGEKEAQARLKKYYTLLKRDDIEYISIKLSSVCSQIDFLAWEDTVEMVKKRLRNLYRLCMQHRYTLPSGKRITKFVNLDMEGYHDLDLTIAAFQQVLDEPEFSTLYAGIVLQAYLPDSFPIQKKITAWAKKRCDKTGGRIKIRLVKGANLAMEKVEASMGIWPQTPYSNKCDVDANFKCMIAYGCRPENAKIVHIGIGSHNLLDIAYGLLLRAGHKIPKYIDFEMLEGMANHQARVIQKITGKLFLYSPIVKKDDFHVGIAYLVRRLDENTTPGNFLRDLFDLEADNNWDKQKTHFLESCKRMTSVSHAVRRKQDRSKRNRKSVEKEYFSNTPDTDWALTANRQWAASLISEWSKKLLPVIPIQIGGRIIKTPSEGTGIDPSRPGTEAYQFVLAEKSHVERAMDIAQTAQKEWGAKSLNERASLLQKAARELEKNRGSLIGCMILDAGKRISEADAEISEAIDFGNYYGRAFISLAEEIKQARFSPLGTVLVAPPWNFPLAIPAGGVFGALMAGNSVLLKPSRETVLVAWKMAECMWKAGIPKKVLQFLPCRGEVGKQLIVDKRVDAVILTGSYETARMFQSWRPNLRLFAETSGKNNIIITSLADRDLAILDLIHSAFSHNGQKCSAASLAICEKEVYDNPLFRKQLRDAVESLPVGPAWKLNSRVTPLTQEPGKNLWRALTRLEPGEEWLVEPKIIDDNPRLWRPGVRLGVKQGSWFHKTECFGPVLGIMKAEDIHHAVDIANDNDYALTAGIQTLDDREKQFWQEHIHAGNLYINRPITGAIVQRQPFGGWKKSCIGPGAKAGGPNYVSQFGHWKQIKTFKSSHPIPEELKEILTYAFKHITEIKARASLEMSASLYAQAWDKHFSKSWDPSAVHGEANFYRYTNVSLIIIRATRSTPPEDLLQILLAARTCRASVMLSLQQDIMPWQWVSQITNVSVEYQLEPELITLIKSADPLTRLRCIEPLSMDLRDALNDNNIAVLDEPVSAIGRLELLQYLREQSYTFTNHRYGNILPEINSDNDS